MTGFYSVATLNENMDFYVKHSPILGHRYVLYYMKKKGKYTAVGSKTELYAENIIFSGLGQS